MTCGATCAKLSTVGGRVGADSILPGKAQVHNARDVEKERASASWSGVLESSSLS